MDIHPNSGIQPALQGISMNEKYPAGDKIRIILDNHSTHTYRETQEYLNTVLRRFEFVFPPKHGSWLNMIEGFFGKMTKQMLSGIRVSSQEVLPELFLVHVLSTIQYHLA